MAESTKRRHCFRYFGNHLDTMFLLIASMVSVTHNRRRISIKVVIVKKLFRKEEKYIFSLFQIANQTFGKSNSAEVVFFLSAIFAAAVFQVNMSHFSTKSRKKSNALRTTGTVMPGRQYHSGQDQGGSSWILENNFLQALLHLGKKILQIQIPKCESQEQK